MVPQMHPVEKSQGDDLFLCHKITPLDKNQTSKKLLMVDITPSSTFASMRNSPFWL